MKFLRKNWLVLLLFLIIFFTRLLVFNKDAAQYWPDESRYPHLIANLDEAFRSGKILLPLQQLFNLDARPGAGLFYYPAAFLEWKIPSVPFALYYNLIINSLILILVFFIVKKIQNTNVAIVTTLLVTLSIASLTYIRHTLPYDIAIFLLLLGLYLHVYFKKIFVFGLLAGFSFLTYPSYYYYLFPIPLMLILFHRSIKPAIFFTLGFSLLLISTQFFSIVIDGASYFRTLQDQSGGVTAIQQGDYIPAASFMSEYILAVDGYWNLFLILAIFPCLFLIKDRKKIVFFALYLTFVFLILESFSHILQKHVLYGRTVRPLYLLALGLSVAIFERVLNNFKSKKIYTFGIITLLLVSFLNWLPRFLTYKNLTYPNQFIRKSIEYLDAKYQKYDIVTNNFDTAFVDMWNTGSPFPNFLKSGRKLGISGKFYTINAAMLFPYYGNYDLKHYCNYEILLKETHTQYIFKPYQYEGYKKTMRNKMEEDPLFYYLIYCK